MSVGIRPRPRLEYLEWAVQGQGSVAVVPYAAALPAPPSEMYAALDAQTISECESVSFELAVAARLARPPGAGSAVPVSPTAMAESLASSQVDGTIATSLDLARALAGGPAPRAARAAAHAVEAHASHVKAATRALGLGAIAAAHTAAGRPDQHGRSTPLRTDHTWIGGTDLWPAGADYVPPQPLRVPALMDELVDFCARTDLDPVAQAAVAHAQVEAIRPFPDGNGRVSRSILSGVWARRGLGGGHVIPVSAALAADTPRHERALAAFRAGDPHPIARLVAHATLRALGEATASAARTEALPGRWLHDAKPRRGSAARELLDFLVTHPVVDAAQVQALTGASQASAYAAIATLAEAGVLIRISPTRRDTVWAAAGVFAEVDAILDHLAGRS